MTVFLVNNFLSHGAGLPGAAAPFQGEVGFGGLLQLVLYPLAVVAALVFVMRSASTTLRTDGRRIANINTFVIRAAFWCVLIVGIGDMVISFMRVEGLLEQAFGEELTSQLGRSQFRGMYVHVPLMVLGVVLACFTRTLGFPG